MSGMLLWCQQFFDDVKILKLCKTKQIRVIMYKVRRVAK